MLLKVELVFLPEDAADQTKQIQQAASVLKIPADRIRDIQIKKRSIDARAKQVKVRLFADVYVDENPVEENKFPFFFHKNISEKKPVHIIGCGPAGMFAALRLIELGFKPVIIERGKNVKDRRRDLAAINKEGIINSDSNYCFGEGGAGTYSDGKLYTRSGKRGSIDRILSILIHHGADSDIMVDAHPHIGTNKLPKLVETIRQTILDSGGEILFNTRLEDFKVNGNKITELILKDISSGNLSTEKCNSLILATGHSARDIYELLDRKNILIEVKPFAIGVRVEHPQEIIDEVQYHQKHRSEFLPPASYSLVHQVNDRGVYSFCMCPGGIIAPAATAENEIVVNGWSPSKRNNPYANSGIVVSVNEKDYSKYKNSGALAGLFYQKEVEQKAFQSGGGKLIAPVQRLIDFTEEKFSVSLPSCSYIPGIKSTQLKDVLPTDIHLALKSAFKAFGKKMKNYFTNEAIVVATESRTSSPVRIPRDVETLQHPQITNLFPCGEGAGYAGGIVSAAIDGERCAEAIDRTV